MISLIRSDAFGPLNQRPDCRRCGRGAGGPTRARRALRVDRGHPSECGTHAAPPWLGSVQPLHVPVRAPPRDSTALTTAPRYADAPTPRADGGGCSPGRGRGAHHGAILASPQVRAFASVSSSSVLRARRAALMARRRCGVSYPAICMQVLTTARRWMRRSPTSKLARFVKWRRELICYSPSEVDDHLMTTDDH